MLFEPLNLNHNPKALQQGFKWRTYINSTTIDKNANEFFTNLLKGKNLNTWITRKIPFFKLFDIQYFIFKFVRANMLLGWLTNNFPLKKPVLILRHPCAVISSQVRLIEYSKVKNPYIAENLYKDYPNLKKNFPNYNNYEEILTARWCQENYVPLICNKSSFVLVSYENLLLNPEIEIKKIFDELNIEIPTNIYKNISLPSKQTRRKINHKNKHIILSDWKTRLNTTQKTNILNVVKDFGMEFYTEELEPDYERLYGDSPINV